MDREIGRQERDVRATLPAPGFDGGVPAARASGAYAAGPHDPGE